MNVCTSRVQITRMVFYGFLKGHLQKVKEHGKHLFIGDFNGGKDLDSYIQTTMGDAY